MAKPVQFDDLLALIAKYLPVSWLYENREEAAEKAIEAPAVDVLQQLADLAQDGDLDEIVAIAQALNTGHTVGFAQAVLRLAETCEIVKLRALIQQFC